jgi:hypothetical protein
MKRNVREVFGVGDFVRQVTADGTLGEVVYEITDRMGGTGCFMRQVGKTNYAKQWFDTSLLTHDLATVPPAKRQHVGVKSIDIIDLADLEAFCRLCRDQLPKGVVGGEVYLKTPLRLSLVRELLTDNSSVHDIHVTLVEG